MNTPKLIAIFLAVFAITSHAATYIITGSGTTFTATKDGSTIGTAGTAIQTVIDGIKTDANGAECTIQFGDGESVLDIGTTGVRFTSYGSPAWGLINLTGKITSANNTASTNSSGTINNQVSIASTADIANTAETNDVVTIYNNGTGAVTIISGGTVSAIGRGKAVSNSSGGTVNISGGTVSATGEYGIAVGNDGTMNISGGTVSATRSVAIGGRGKTTVSGDAIITSSYIFICPVDASCSGSSPTISLDFPTSTLEITGGIVKSTGTYAAIAGSGTATISGGAIFAYGTDVTDVINCTYTADGNAAIIAWNKSAGTTTYPALATTDIFSASPTTATWNGRNGIAYANGANTGFIPIEEVTVNKLTDQTNEAPPTLQISASNTNQHTYSLSTIALEKLDHGALTYELKEFLDGSSILTAKPTLSADGHTITYTGTGKESGEATLKVTVTSDNYTDLPVTITFKATPKTEVTITGITAQNSVYDGTPKKGYTGTATALPYTGALVYEYAGTNHPQSTAPPTNVGEYTLRVTLPPNAPYTGEWRGTFSITAANPILPQIATGSIRVQATANAITLENLPKNTKVQIYSLQGKQIYSNNSDNSQILRIVVQTKGMYVVKVGSQTVRVAVR